MTKQELIQQIKEKQSFLCVGLDTDIKKIPAHLLDTEDPVFEFLIRKTARSDKRDTVLLQRLKSIYYTYRTSVTQMIAASQSA